MKLTEAEKIAADRIARAIEKGTGYSMDSSARMAQAAIGYIQGAGFEIRASNSWQPIETAPQDGSAILGYGRHTASPPDAQRGVKIGDHWWSIMLWDVYRPKAQWVFAKDGAATWSKPTHWMPLPDAPA